MNQTMFLDGDVNGGNIVGAISGLRANGETEKCGVEYDSILASPCHDHVLLIAGVVQVSL